VTSLLLALAMDGEEVLRTFYKQSSYKAHKDAGAAVRCDPMAAYKRVKRPRRCRQRQGWWSSRKKLTVRQPRQLAREGSGPAASATRS